MDVRALQHYLVLQYVPEPATMDPPIRRIESGTHVTVRPGPAVGAERYFRPVFAAAPGDRPTSSARRCTSGSPP